MSLCFVQFHDEYGRKTAGLREFSAEEIQILTQFLHGLDVNKSCHYRQFEVGHDEPGWAAGNLERFEVLAEEESVILRRFITNPDNFEPAIVSMFEFIHREPEEDE